jgi:hypothetical protein
LNIVVVRKYFSNPKPGNSSEQGWERIRETFDAVASRVIVGLGVIGTATFMLRNYNPTKDNAVSLVDDIKRQLSPSDIQHSSTNSITLAMLHQKGTYVSRPTLESTITSIVNRQEPNMKYFVVYGPKGVGKSVLINKCVQGKKGVVKVLISSVFEKRGILQVLSTEILGEGAAAVNEMEMVNILDNAKVDGRLPTLIFEIERGQGPEQKACVNNVRSLCKQFAVCSNCIIILSETNAVLVFGQDRDREEIILVPELTRDEALTFVRRRKGIAMDEEEMMRLFQNIGTTAATLENFLDGTMSVDEFIVDNLAAATHDLEKFPFQPILKALKAHPEGVSPAYFKSEKCEGVNMTDEGAVGAVMKAVQSNVVFFDMKKGCISSARMHSRWP